MFGNTQTRSKHSQKIIKKITFFNRQRADQKQTKNTSVSRVQFYCHVIPCSDFENFPRNILRSNYSLQVVYFDEPLQKLSTIKIINNFFGTIFQHIIFLCTSFQHIFFFREI